MHASMGVGGLSLGSRRFASDYSSTYVVCDEGVASATLRFMAWRGVCVAISRRLGCNRMRGTRRSPANGFTGDAGVQRWPGPQLFAKAEEDHRLDLLRADGFFRFKVFGWLGTTSKDGEGARSEGAGRAGLMKGLAAHASASAALHPLHSEGWKAASTLFHRLYRLDGPAVRSRRATPRGCP